MLPTTDIFFLKANTVTSTNIPTSKKIEYFAKLKINVVRAVSMEGVGTETSLNRTEEWELRQIGTTL